MYNIGHMGVDICPQEDDSIHHQAGEHIHLGYIQLPFLHDIGSHTTDDLVIVSTGNPTMLGSKFFKFF